MIRLSPMKLTAAAAAAAATAGMVVAMRKRRHAREAAPEPDIIHDFKPWPSIAQHLATTGPRTYFRPTFLGMEQLDTSRPALYVGNHTLYALLDVPLLMEHLIHERGLYLRPLGDRGHFEYPGWKQFLLKIGVVPANPENCDKLMEAGESVLVYPGGAREVWHHKDENYTLVWKKRLGFARQAAKHGYDIIPFASLGADECYTILADGDDFRHSRPVQKALKVLGVPHLFRDGEAVPPLVRGLGPTLAPRPQALYFSFGERISTAGVDVTDESQLWAMREKVATAIYRQLDELRAYRKQDRDRNWGKWRKRYAD